MAQMWANDIFADREVDIKNPHRLEEKPRFLELSEVDWRHNIMLLVLAPDAVMCTRGTAIVYPPGRRAGPGSCPM